MPRYRVKLTTHRWDEVELIAPNEDVAIEHAKLHYDNCNSPEQVIWSECEEEQWPDVEIECVDEEDPDDASRFCPVCGDPYATERDADGQWISTAQMYAAALDRGGHQEICGWDEIDGQADRAKGDRLRRSH